MIPKGAVWQYLRQAALSTVPEGVVIKPNDPTSLATWQAHGYYKVLNSERRGFDLEVPNTDIGSALLMDAEHLLDAATEHQVCIWRHVNSSHWLSPAWLAVTFYYWTFFLMLALTRLLGRSTWYIGQAVARNLAQLAPTQSTRPGQGCFRLELGQLVSASDRELFLRKRDSRLHEEVWRNWDSICCEKLLPLLQGSANSMEDRLYTAIVRSTKALGPEWPSSFRNAVNYRQGFAYSAVRRIKVLESYSYLRQPLSYDFGVILERFERGASSVRRVDIENSPDGIAKLLVDYTFLIHMVTTELHSELLERRHLDLRWRNARLRFGDENGLRTKSGVWPL